MASHLLIRIPCFYTNVFALSWNNYLKVINETVQIVQWIPLYWSTSVRGYFGPIKWRSWLSKVWLFRYRTFFFDKVDRLRSWPVKPVALLSGIHCIMRKFLMYIIILYSILKNALGYIKHNFVPDTWYCYTSKQSSSSAMHIHLNVNTSTCAYSEKQLELQMCWGRLH